MPIYEDQNQNQTIVKRINVWIYNSTDQFLLLDGSAGTGKTYIIGHYVSTTNTKCLVTAPTNEAVNQLQLAINKHNIKKQVSIVTTHVALGFGFDTNTQQKTLKQIKIPNLDDYELLIVDEGSMVSEEQHLAIQRTKIKCLYVAHRAQLPEVKKEVDYFDRCESYIYTLGLQTIRLTKQYRQRENYLYNFCNEIEQNVYRELPKKPLNKSYNCDLHVFNERMVKEKAVGFVNDIDKVLCWTNNTASIYNQIIRSVFFGSKSLQNPFLQMDRLLLMAPVFGGIKLSNNCKTIVNTENVLTTNSKFMVIGHKNKVILGLDTFELETLDIQGKVKYLYIIKDNVAFETRLRSMITDIFRLSRIKQPKAWQVFHRFCDMFARVTYNYALTIHRSQGMTIPNVVLVKGDIYKCRNPWLRAKLLYVGVSRTSNNLQILV